MNLLTELREGLSISWSAIRANKLRSALTTLGIVIGIVTVTLMGTAISGLNSSFMKSVSSIGADVLFVDRRSWFIKSAQEWIEGEKRPAITLALADGLARQLTMASAIAPKADNEEDVNYQKRRASDVDIVGTTENYQTTMGLTVAAGRFMSAGECNGGRPVCVLGSVAATNLFLNESPLGKKILIDQHAFEVVGVLEKLGGFAGDGGVDGQIIIPIPQYTKFIERDPDYEIQIKIGQLGQMEDARDELRAVMRRLRQIPPGKPDDFTINQQDEFLDLFHQLAGTIGTVGIFITGLSLFVGGIGIMNIMFVSVAERTREIGVRKAIGAKRRTILLQFLTEAATICLLGGLIALAIAWPATLLLNNIMPASLSPMIVGIALLVSLVTGVVSGFLPAWRAARMNPVDALRNE
jgi:putative ABC transport system permease protein